VLSLWNKFQAWLKSKNVTTHTVGAAILTFAVAYDSSPDLRNYIGTVFVGYPVVVTKLGILTANIVAGVTLWAKFSHSSSSAGTLAKAQTIASLPNPPTQAAIDAAKPSIQ
jgi:hypothetical protein